VKYVKRGENASWNGFYVQVPGAPSKLFSIRKLGLFKALREALLHRDRLLAARPELSGNERHIKTRDKRNRSGVVGVCRVTYWKTYKYKRTRKRTRRTAWVAQAALVRGRTRNPLLRREDLRGAWCAPAGR